MSLIDGLIDELNKSADEWNGSNMFELARMCREAADTIWQLRDDLQRANAENAKLRELVVDMREAFIHGSCYRWCEFKEPCDGKCQYIDRMRELGVEVTS